MTGLDLLPILLEDALWSAVAAVGFSMLFNVPVRTLPGCAILAAIGHMTRALLVQLGSGVEVATLAGATLIGFIGVLFARRWHAPALVFTVSSAIPMVPGALAFQAMLGLLRLPAAEEAARTLILTAVAIDSIKTALILGAIAVGITAPSLLFVRQPLHN